jgi:ribosomal protein S6
MATYELMLIISPSISEEERQASLDNLKSLLKKSKAKVEKEDIW